jgi:hypothetical protein
MLERRLRELERRRISRSATLYMFTLSNKENVWVGDPHAFNITPRRATLSILDIALFRNIQTVQELEDRCQLKF